MKFKVRHYSTDRLRSEIELAKSRLRGYLAARAEMPMTSILGTLAIAAGIKHEESFIAALKEEYDKRIEADSSAAE